MRTLLHRDIEILTHAGPTHLAHRLACKRERPSKPLITIMDYTQGDAQMRVRFLKDERAQDHDFDVQWDEHISRAARSGGCMELHLMLVRDGTKIRRIMFPQRSESSALHDGLMRIFSEVPQDYEGQEEILELLEANERLVEIH